MSQIVTLYSDKENTDALYPRTKVSAISDDSNTPLKELMTGMVKQEEGGTEEEVVTPINADTLGGKLTADNVVFYEEEMVDEFGQVVVKNADKLNNKDGDYYDYRNSTLTLEEIQASTDLTGKIASASALNYLIKAQYETIPSGTTILDYIKTLKYGIHYVFSPANVSDSPTADGNEYFYLILKHTEYGNAFTKVFAFRVNEVNVYFRSINYTGNAWMGTSWAKIVG